jgi:thioredoxin-dependent peroxiredoxin
MTVRASAGETAPDFTLKGASGETVTLSSFKGKERVLLVFYPRDMTSGCTDQLSAIRNEYDAFRAAETQPFGVNDDPADSHQRFIDELELPFDLLVDEGLKTADAYDALRAEGDRISRTVFIVGKSGKIIFRQAGAPAPEELLAVISSAND